MKKLFFIMVSGVVAFGLVKLYYMKDGGFKNIAEVQSTIAQKEQSSTLPATKTNSQQALQVSPDTVALVDILKTPADVEKADAGSMRGIQNPFNVRFQTEAEIISYVDTRIRLSKVDVTSDQRKILINARMDELYGKNVVYDYYGSAVDGIIQNFKKQHESILKPTAPSSLSVPNITIIP